MVNFYIRDSPWLKPGDILYVGHKTNVKNSKSFVIINKQRKAVGYKDDAISLPISYKSQLPKQLDYKSMIYQSVASMESTIQDTSKASNLDFGHCFFAGREVEKDFEQSIIDEYATHGLA
jgi:hypothetical protein